MKTTWMLPMLLVAALLAGCGGGGGSSASGGGGGGKGIPTGGGGVNGISVSNCLILEDFLVQPSQTTIDGTSPGGVAFTLTFYKSTGAANAVFKKKNPKTTAIVENGVVDFKGNPSPYKGAPPAKISQRELSVIKRCIDKNKKES
jgi:hypothetical protein